MSEQIKTIRHTDGEYKGVMEIIIDRPKANAVDAKTSLKMCEAFAEFRDDGEMRIAVLRAEGEKFFSAGWDLSAAADGEAPDADFGATGFGGLTELWDCNKPIICAVNGYAMGGGFEFVLASDIIIASDNAVFGLPEPFVGVIADSGGILRLPKRLPHHIAMDMLLSGRQMKADEALKWGLVNDVVALEKLQETAMNKAKELLGLAPLALQSIKAITRECEDLSIEDGFKKMRSGEIEVYKKMLNSDDAKEGPLAFTEKRDPKWTGK